MIVSKSLQFIKFIIIKTEILLQTTIIDFILGKLRLNSYESKRFRSLPNVNKDEFFDEMRIELSKNIPVDNSRIKKIKYNDEYDKTSGVVGKFVTFLFQIVPPNDDCFNKKSSKQVVDDLNSLITTKDFIT